MILDSLEFLHRYSSIHPLFHKAADFIKNNDLSALSPGRHDIQGDDLYVIIAADEAKPGQVNKLEAHEQYIDIQLALQGSFRAGWQARGTCTQIEKEYNAEQDFMLFADQAETFIELRPGTFAIFFPQDAHSPQPPDTTVLKAVFKVHV
jgi:YhcH/YjgK/YiaL family protein